MRLLTHNMLVCNVKACLATARRTDGTLLSFPLKIAPNPRGLVQEATDFNAELIEGLIPKLDWAALRKTAAELGVASLPEKIPDGAVKDEGFLKSVHKLIMDIHVQEGSLVCPNCGRAYPITKGIPNMLLAEDEV